MNSIKEVWVTAFKDSIDTRQLLWFVRMWFLILLGYSLVLFLQSKPGWEWISIASISIYFIYKFSPRLFHLPYRLWMCLGGTLGTLVQFAGLTLLYVFFITPVGLVKRARQAKSEPAASLFQTKKPRDKFHYERLY